MWLNSYLETHHTHGSKKVGLHSFVFVAN